MMMMIMNDSSHGDDDDDDDINICLKLLKIKCKFFHQKMVEQNQPGA